MMAQLTKANASSHWQCLSPWHFAAFSSRAPGRTITGQAAVVAVIGQFKILMIAMLLVSPLVLLLRKPSPTR
ncbi:MAG: hypothetical protein ACLQJR_34750 [Stellaceae bacterium]